TPGAQPASAPRTVRPATTARPTATSTPRAPPPAPSPCCQTLCVRRDGRRRVLALPIPDALRSRGRGRARVCVVQTYWVDDLPWIGVSNARGSAPRSPVPCPPPGGVKKLPAVILFSRCPFPSSPTTCESPSA